MAIEITDYLLARKPGLNIDARVSTLIEIAKELLDTAAFGVTYNQAVGLKVLHMLEMESRGGVAGAVVSETEGDLSRSYSSSIKADDGDLSATRWGAELIQLKKTSIISPLLRTMF
jgi:hypothetical protein